MARIGGWGERLLGKCFLLQRSLHVLFARGGSNLSVHCACYIVGGNRIYGGKFFARFSKHRRLEVIQFSRIILSLGPKVSNNDDSVIV